MSHYGMQILQELLELKKYERRKADTPVCGTGKRVKGGLR